MRTALGLANTVCNGIQSAGETFCSIVVAAFEWHFGTELTQFRS